MGADDGLDAEPELLGMLAHGLLESVGGGRTLGAALLGGVNVSSNIGGTDGNTTATTRRTTADHGHHGHHTRPTTPTTASKMLTQTT